jgi:amino acid adenylation domain-containing protein
MAHDQGRFGSAVTFTERSAPRPRDNVGSDIPALFSIRCSINPDAVAVRANGLSLTYRQLDERADRLARLLISAHVTAETPVLVLMQRSPDVLAAFLAILKAGGTYVPVPEGYPAARLRAMVKDMAAPVLLTDPHLAGRAVDVGCEVIVVDGATGVRQEDSAATQSVRIHPDQLAYVMFTSGSTGAPKGVGITHRDVVDFVHDHIFTGDRHTRVLMIAPHAFDPSTYEIWVPLLRGGSVVLLPPGPFEVAEMRRLVEEEEVTGLLMTAGLFRVVADEAPESFSGLREVMTGGDVITPKAVRRVQQSCRDTVVRATYGPTEATLFATQCELTEGEEWPGGVPIGRPLDNMRAYVLDERLAAVGIGQVGELYLAGTGVARGYFGRPDLTAERFVAEVSASGGGRMYRTGDLVRWNVDGLLEFVGRTDHQVKIRGFRVEPAEVEAALADCPRVSEIAVVAREYGTGDKRLIAYVVGDAEVAELRDYATDQLAEYLVPATFVKVDRVPLTANGKVDYEALPVVEAQSHPRARGPRTPSERILCELFAEVLGVASVGIDDVFFELGGHSLLAARLISRVRAVLGVDVTIGQLLQAPTVAGISEMIESASMGLPLQAVLPLRGTGRRPPVFCLHPGGGLAWCYFGLLRYIPKEYPVYGLQSRRLTESTQLPPSVAELADGYVARIREIQPTGPYRLLGWSFGGVLAQAVAARFQRQGESIASLVLLDAGRHDFDDVGHRELLELALEATDAFRAEPGEGRLPVARVKEILESRQSPLAGLDEEVLAVLLETAEHNLELNAKFVPEHMTGDAVVIEAAGRDGTPSGVSALWDRVVAGNVETHVVPFDHRELMTPPALAAIGPIIMRVLKQTPQHG